MKTNMKQTAAVIALMVGLFFLNQAAAHPVMPTATITTFDNFTSDALYPSWSAATIDSTPTNYILTATGYGSNYKYIGYPAINGIGCTNIELDVTLSAPTTNADGHLGPIVDLIDGDDTRYSYRWYGQLLGHHVLNMPVDSPTTVVKAGTVPGLNLATLTHMHMQLDPGGYGTSGPYTVAWNNLRLTGPVDLCASELSSFVNFALDSVWDSWSTATIVTNLQGYQITATGYGKGYKALATPLDASVNTNIQLTITLNAANAASAAGLLGPIVTLIDGNGSTLRFAWYGQSLGAMVLTKPLTDGVLTAAGTNTSFDLRSITGYNLELDPSTYTSDTYTVAWQHLDLTGGSCSTTPIVVTPKSFNPATREFTLTWSSSPGRTYAIQVATNVTTAFGSLKTNVPSGGASTSNTVVMPNATAGFLRVQQE
jgi:hypothetical protein